MDYSKWKKICIILTIITLIVHICSTVFGAYEFSGINDTTYILPDEVNEYKYILVVAATWQSYVYASNTELYINERGGNIFVGFKETGVSYIRASKNSSSNRDFSSSTFNSYTSGTTFSNTDQLYTSLSLAGGSVRASNYDVKNSLTNEISFESTNINVPTIGNTVTSLETLDFDVISINANGYSTQDFDVLFYDLNVTNSDSTDFLYPKRVITLNQNTSYFKSEISADSSKNAIYWIPIDEVGLNFYVGGSYGIKFAKRVPLDEPVSGADFTYEYLGESVQFTISSDVSQDKINAINKEIEDMTEKKYHDETISSINNINNNINNLNNNINNVNDSLTNTTPDSSIDSDISDSFDYDNSNSELTSNYEGFFSRLTAMFTDMYDYNTFEDSIIELPLPHTNKKIVLHSNIISSHVVEPLKSLITAFWMYVFYLYCWKFFNHIFIIIEEGKILDENSLDNVPGTLHASVF